MSYRNNLLAYLVTNICSCTLLIFSLGYLCNTKPNSHILRKVQKSQFQDGGFVTKECDIEYDNNSYLVWYLERKEMICIFSINSGLVCRYSGGELLHNMKMENPLPGYTIRDGVCLQASEAMAQGPAKNISYKYKCRC